MNDTVRLLNSVGKKVFVDYFYEFKNVDDKKKVAEKLLKEIETASSIGAQTTRINSSIRIFQAKAQIEALDYVINSTVDAATIKKAQERRNSEL